jgi:hypothetical protein
MDVEVLLKPHTYRLKFADQMPFSQLNEEVMFPSIFVLPSVSSPLPLHSQIAALPLPAFVAFAYLSLH